MRNKIIALVIVVAIVTIALYLKSGKSPQGPGSRAEQTGPAAAAPNGQGLPRFVDLGTTSCAPCKVMLGVMAELEQKYPGEMVIEFVNVGEQREEARRYGVRIIPTQIFYAPDGRELYRHTGVFRADEVVAKWAELGYPMQSAEKK